MWGRQRGGARENKSVFLSDPGQLSGGLVLLTVTNMEAKVSVNAPVRPVRSSASDSSFLRMEKKCIVFQKPMFTSS